MQDIVILLKQHTDETYAEFQRKLIPTVDPATVIGVRTPILRKLAKEIAKDKEICEAFFREPEHTYFDEKQLHGFIISGIKDFELAVKEVEAFLPQMDNWATCDQTSPKIFKKHTEELLPYIYRWIEGDAPYTRRFAIGMLMQHYLDDAFLPEYLELVASMRSDEYYVNMEIAWYMATALAKQWDAAIAMLEDQRMDVWTHNKTIQKARESYRITAEQKEYLKSLKRKTEK